jgi:hypothetical protein
LGSERVDKVDKYTAMRKRIDALYVSLIDFFHVLYLKKFMNDIFQTSFFFHCVPASAGTEPLKLGSWVHCLTSALLQLGMFFCSSQTLM